MLKTRFENTLEEPENRLKLICPFISELNAKVKRSPRKENEEFYSFHKFYSFYDFETN